jgi:hypothetical protein
MRLEKTQKALFKAYGAVMYVFLDVLPIVKAEIKDLLKISRF